MYDISTWNPGNLLNILPQVQEEELQLFPVIHLTEKVMSSESKSRSQEPTGLLINLYWTLSSIDSKFVLSDGQCLVATISKPFVFLMTHLVLGKHFGIWAQRIQSFPSTTLA